MTRSSLAHVTAASLLATLIPAIGSAAPLPRPPPPILTSVDDPPLFGDKDDLMYFRDPRDYIRLYPHARLSVEGHGFFGSRVDTISKSRAGADLGPRFFVREARLAMGGELLQRFAFDAALDLAANPAIDGARVDGTKTVVALSDAWVSVDDGPGLVLSMGYYEAPFSLENRTATSDLPMMERNLAIRGFVVPGSKVLGTSVGGVSLGNLARWDVGVFGGESFAPGDIQRSFQGIGRFRLFPLATQLESAFRNLQVGMSVRWGSQNRRDAAEDAPAINTGQGFALFRPTLTEGGQTLHVIPSGAQYAAGGEFRLPFHDFVFTSEAYWVTRHTQEANLALVDDVERLGSLQGWGWYVEASTWILQLFDVIEGEPPVCGEYPHPEHLELADLPPKVGRYGLELALIAAGVNASYRGDSRGGAPTGPRATNVEAYQFGFAVNYWQTARFRLSFSYNWYFTPKSGSNGNLLAVPGNIAQAPDSGAHALGELGARATAMF